MESRLQFKLCYICWVSKSIYKFHSKNNVCAKCINSKRSSPRVEYYAFQQTLPLDQRKNVCVICIEEKYQSQFVKSKNHCLDCSRVKNKANRNKHIDQRRADDRERYAKDPKKRYEVVARWRKTEKGIVGRKQEHSKRRAAKLNAVDLMPDDWWNILLEICEYRCLNPECSKLINEKNVLSHDHIIPLSWEESVHSLGNSQILCASCNSSKNSYSDIDYRTKEMKQKLETYDQLKLNSDIDIVL